LLIALLIVLTAILLIASIATKDSKAPSPTPTPEITKEIRYATLHFSENPRISTISGRYEIDVDMDTNKNEINIIQIELSYDPDKLRIYDIVPAEFLQNSEVLQKKIDPESGRIKYWLAVNDQQEWIQGSGSVATITFSKIGTGPTELIFQPKTSVNATDSNESVLNEMISGIIDKLPTPSPIPTKIQIPTTAPPIDN